MKIIVEENCSLKTETVIGKGGRIISKTENKSDENKSVKVEVDSVEQKYQLRTFLEERGFKQSDGMFGKQRDFGIWAQGNTNWVQLQFQNKKRFERLYKCALEWFNLNSK